MAIKSHPVVKKITKNRFISPKVAKTFPKPKFFTGCKIYSVLKYFSRKK